MNTWKCCIYWGWGHSAHNAPIAGNSIQILCWYFRVNGICINTPKGICPFLPSPPTKQPKGGRTPLAPSTFSILDAYAWKFRATVKCWSFPVPILYARNKLPHFLLPWVWTKGRPLPVSSWAVVAYDLLKIWINTFYFCCHRGAASLPQQGNYTKCQWLKAIDLFQCNASI